MRGLSSDMGWWCGDGRVILLNINPDDFGAGDVGRFSTTYLPNTYGSASRSLSAGGAVGQSQSVVLAPGATNSDMFGTLPAALPEFDSYEVVVRIASNKSGAATPARGSLLVGAAKGTLSVYYGYANDNPAEQGITIGDISYGHAGGSAHLNIGSMPAAGLIARGQFGKSVSRAKWWAADSAEPAGWPISVPAIGGTSSGVYVWADWRASGAAAVLRVGNVMVTQIDDCYDTLLGSTFPVLGEI